MAATVAHSRAEPTHADLIRALVADVPPLPDEQREQVRRLIRRGQAT